MPLYVYSCAECAIELEELRPVDQADWPPVECPICHGLCQREVSLFSVQRAQIATQPHIPASSALRSAYHGPDCPCCRRS